MKKENSFLFILIAITFLGSGCGSFTKMRYSRGYKSNLEFHFKKRTGNEEVFKAAHAVKKQKVVKRAAIFENKTIKEIGGFLILSNPKFRKGYINRSNKKENFGVDLIRKVKPESKEAVKDKGSKSFRRPIERHALSAGILFYGSIALMILFFAAVAIPTGFAASLQYAVLATFVVILGSVLMIIGLFQAVASLRYIRESGGLYSGKVLSLSIILWFVLFFLGIALLAII